MGHVAVCVLIPTLNHSKIHHIRQLLQCAAGGVDVGLGWFKFLLLLLTDCSAAKPFLLTYISGLQQTYLVQVE